MMRTKVFNNLLEWIEENLSAEMKVDDIAKKSGYSRRYIYQLFVDKLGVSPIEYLRGRRLCQATNWLKLTNVSGQQIANKLGYSCYQAFSRDFRKHFNVSPIEFRKNHEWNMNGIQVTPFRSDISTDISLCNILNMSEMKISGYEFSYTESVPYLAENRIGIRKSIISQEITKCGGELYILSEIDKKDDSENSFSVKCFIGVSGEVNYKKCTLKKVYAGRYLKYSFSGNWEEYKLLPIFLSVSVLPLLGLIRRDVYDIERFYCDEDYSLEDNISCEYYIPVS
ncbi:transcriptional regulator [Escherichia coli]|uniref:helix-turn-helix domain-containing protein n=1 Tax=Escherichia coli TaxID=562 RepID=UPI00098C7FA0|nr:helix-turn-helix domain-containing protein [Escherichia coli]GDM43935.1 transcriptional regulator [Escherichia coli]HAJ1320580.1 helix-turn-helix domain-containing protein [Escherichia coli]